MSDDVEASMGDPEALRQAHTRPRDPDVPPDLAYNLDDPSQAKEVRMEADV